MFGGGHRSTLRSRHKIAIALGASILLAVSGLTLEPASASTRSMLAVSLNPDRSSAARLGGSTVKEKVYIFVRNSKKLDRVDFYLDSSRRTKRLVGTDTKPPFDFAGTALRTAPPIRTTPRNLLTDRTPSRLC
jgi:hypothetical protein